MFQLLFGLVLSMAMAQTPAKVYVTAATAKLKASKEAGAEDLHIVKRGEELAVKGLEGNWYQVEVAGKSGWISKLFVNTNKPIGQSDLMKDDSVTNEKMSRKRTSEYSVSAATRGLSAGSRQGKGREQFRSNQQALEKLEANQVKPEEVKAFEKESGAENP